MSAKKGQDERNYMNAKKGQDERNYMSAKKGQDERNYMSAKERNPALSATPNPYRETSKKLVQYQGHFALNLGVFSPFRAALRCAFRALSSFAEP